MDYTTQVHWANRLKDIIIYGDMNSINSIYPNESL